MGNTYAKYSTSSSYKKNLFNMIDNYIYFYHIDKFILIPAFPESITDTSNVSFLQNTPISRSAPIFSYSNSGPRSLNINLKLHRDLMTDINYQTSNYSLDIDDDYVDALAKLILAAALPRYEASTMTVKPPVVALRLGDEIFIKGVVLSSVTVSYEGPILYKDNYEKGKYAYVTINFGINEIDPYSADMAIEDGSFRGVCSTLDKKLFNQDTEHIGTQNNSNVVDPYINSGAVNI